MSYCEITNFFKFFRFFTYLIFRPSDKALTVLSHKLISITKLKDFVLGQTYIILLTCTTFIEESKNDDSQDDDQVVEVQNNYDSF